MLIAEQTGIRAMLTYRIDEEAARFYTRFGCIASPLREQQRLLLLQDARRWVRRTMSIESLPTFTKPARQRWESIAADRVGRLWKFQVSEVDDWVHAWGTHEEQRRDGQPPSCNA
jgi:hypothetical protein